MAVVVQKAGVVSEDKKPKSAPAHPPYLVMIKEAIVALKERTGSSQYAIAKYIEEKQQPSSHLPQNFKKILSVQLKKLVVNEKLVKVKNSFKLAPALKSAAEPKPKPKAALVTKPKSKKEIKEVKSKVKAAPDVKAVVEKKPAKVAKTATITSPGKKVKKVVTKKPKSIKSPVKKAAAAAKRTRK